MIFDCNHGFMCKCVHILFSILNGITAHAIEIEMHHKIKFYDGSGILLLLRVRNVHASSLACNFFFFHTYRYTDNAQMTLMRKYKSCAQFQLCVVAISNPVDCCVIDFITTRLSII